MRSHLFLTVLLLLLFTCSGRRDIRDYYFPVRELINERGMVYAYENTGSIPGPDTVYWYYLGVDLDTALYLSATRYGPDYAPQQLSREQVTNDGVIKRELTVFSPDTTGQAVPANTEILFNKSFPFYLNTPPDAAGYRIRTRLDPTHEAVTYVSLDRRFHGDTTLNILGKNRDAIVFKLAGEVSERDPELGDISPQFTGYEIYARGLGLVEYHRDLGAAGHLGGRLVRRVGMPRFTEERFQIGQSRQE